MVDECSVGVSDIFDESDVQLLVKIVREHVPFNANVLRIAVGVACEPLSKGYEPRTVTIYRGCRDNA